MVFLLGDRVFFSQRSQTLLFCGAQQTPKRLPGKGKAGGS